MLTSPKINIKIIRLCCENARQHTKRSMIS